MNSYHVIPITVVTSFLYCLSYIMVRTGKLKLVFHKKIWNVFLAISFLTSGVLGLILAFMLDQKMDITWYREILWFHVEFGIVMGLISLFHVCWHLRYFFPKRPKVVERGEKTHAL